MAVTVAVPATTAVTSPVCDTVATAVLSELQVTTRSLRTRPFASRSVAVAWVVSTAVIVLDASVTLIEAIGADVTVSVPLPALPSLVAVMIVVPAASAVIAPVSDTVATSLRLDDHTITRPVSVEPLLSRVTAFA
jgi:hypothetical protein